MLVDAADLAESMLISSALSFEAFRANLSVIHEAAARMRPHAGEVAASARLRELMVGSGLWRSAAPRATSRTRCRSAACRRPPGALYDALSLARGTMEIELNSAGDNPLVVVDEDAIVSVGNFDVVALAMAFDFVRLGFVHAAQVANERVQKLLWDHFSGLPTGLTATDGPTGGLRPLGRSVAALVAEARLLANPVSLDYSGQVAEGIEDHASMAPLAVRTTSRLVSLMHRIVALELIIGAQAVDLRGGPEHIGEGPRVAYEFVRERVAMLTDETEWAVDIEGLTRQVGDGELGAPRRGGDQPAPEPLRARGAGDLTMAVGPIERAVDLLARVADEPGDATVATLASDAGLPTSTAYRLLAALERHGLVQRDAASTVSLGTRVVALGRAAEASLQERLVVPAAADDGAPRARAGRDRDPHRAVRHRGDRAAHGRGRAHGPPLLRRLPPRADAPRRVGQGRRRLARAGRARALDRGGRRPRRSGRRWSRSAAAAGC